MIVRTELYEEFEYHIDNFHRTCIRAVNLVDANNRLEPQFQGFAKNDVAFSDATGVDHDALGEGLKKALYNYMHGIGLEQDVRRWFDMPVPKPRVARHVVERALEAR